MCLRWSSGWGCLTGRMLAAAAIAASAAACSDPSRPARQAPPGGQLVPGVRQVPLRPGEPLAAHASMENPYTGDASALKDGRRLYEWMNCVGCHFDGGGGMGPPLMDEKWIYGRDPEQIFDSIANGRPEGMPAFGDKLVADEIWRIVAYVQTLERSEEDEGSGQQESGGNGR